MAKKQTLNIHTAHTKALTFVREYISKNALGLPDGLSDDAFAALMNGVTQAMLAAWLDGFTVQS